MQGSFEISLFTSIRMHAKNISKTILNAKITFLINRNSDADTIGADPHSFPSRTIADEEFLEIHHTTS